MKTLIPIAILLPFTLFGCTQRNMTETSTRLSEQAPSSTLKSASPALTSYTQKTLLGDVWNRPQLSTRDRSVITLAVLIARNQSAEMPFYLNLALDNGLKPAEISEMITHLAFYSGWGNATAAATVTGQVFEKRGIDSASLPGQNVEPLAIDQLAEAKRERDVSAQFSQVSPGVVQYTSDAVFNSLWRRPGLAPRDRSLITVSALVANGQVGQITFHLNKAMDNGLTQPQAGEVLTQLAFYAGWPNVFSAMPVFRQVFESRQS